MVPRVFACIVVGLCLFQASLARAQTQGDEILTDFEPMIVAGSYLDDPPDEPENRVDPNTVDSLFAGVGSIGADIAGVDYMRGTCTLLSRRHVLTAAHIVDSNHDGVGDYPVSKLVVHFNVGGDSTHVYDVVDYVIQPDFTGFANPSINDDLAIVTLAQNADPIIPIYPLLARPVVYQEVLTMVGYGRSGIGDNPGGGYRSPYENFTIKRWGMNVVDLAFEDDDGTTALEAFVFDFDDPDGLFNVSGGPSLGNFLETTLGPGDSGGPAFAWENNQFRVAGVDTYTARFVGSPDNPPLFGSAGGGILVETYADWIEDAIDFNRVHLNVVGSPAYLQPGDSVTVNLDTLCLGQPVVALQAFMQFSSDHFSTATGDVAIAPGGGVWDELIYSMYDSGGDLDVVVGVELVPGDPSFGVIADSTAATMTLKSTGEGQTTVVFRPDADPDPGLTETTLLSTIAGTPVLPVKRDSQTIVIDGTPPVLENLIVLENQPNHGQVDVLNCAATAVQGILRISVDASDVLAGLVAPPTLVISGPASIQTVLVAHLGTTYTWQAPVLAGLPNGTYDLTVTATDRSGNSSQIGGQICVNKNRISGLVELEGFIGYTREVTFVATGDQLIEPLTWKLVIGNFNGNAYGSYTLDHFPDGVTGVSARTDWNLRRKLSVVQDLNGQITANFTGADQLPGGDINGSNSVNILDYGTLKRFWFTNDPTADINGDGQVQTFDYALLAGNWFVRGDDE